jgi:hypothetical protein
MSCTPFREKGIMMPINLKRDKTHIECRETAEIVAKD